MSTKKGWTTSEIALIIHHADHCIRSGENYEETIVDELAKFSSRTVAYNMIRDRLWKIFKSYGIADPSMTDFGARGITYLDINTIPTEVLTEINNLRQGERLPPLQAEEAKAQPSPAGSDDDFRLVEDGDTIRQSSAEASIKLTRQQESSITKDRTESQAVIDHRSETLRVAETPEPLGSFIPGTDGTSERPSISPLTSPSELAPSPKPATRKQRAAASDDLDYANDPDYLESEPSLKKVKSKAFSSGRSITKAPRGPRGIVSTKTSSAKSSSGRMPKTQATTQSQREPSAVSIDEPSKDADVAAPSGQVATSSNQVDASSSQVSGSAAEATGHHNGKRKADLMVEEVEIDPSTSLKRPKNEKSTSESVVNTKLDACLSLIGTLIMHQSGISEETSDHLYQVLRTLEDPKGSVVEDLIKDLDSQRALKARYSDMIKKLVDFEGLGSGIDFPKEPRHEEIRHSWKAVFENIVFMVGLNNIKPSISAASAAYLASSAENIAYGRISDDQLPTYIESLNPLLKSPHAQQTLFSALFCHYVFTNPESMLRAMHSDGMMHLYNAELSSASSTAAGLAKVQQYEKVVARLLFQDPAFQGCEFKHRVTDLKTSLQKKKDRICQESKIPLIKPLSRVAKEIIEMKQQLLLSPKHYRIHYVRPNTPFDVRWMEAYDQENFPVPDAKAVGKKVVLCLFPALTCEKGVPVKDDAKVEDVLVKNKRFFPTFQEMIDFDPGVQLSKAMVLVVPDEESKR